MHLAIHFMKIPRKKLKYEAKTWPKDTIPQSVLQLMITSNERAKFMKKEKKISSNKEHTSASRLHFQAKTRALSTLAKPQVISEGQV
jgi:hypothetical protein